MNDREKIAWLYRRAGFGLGPGQLDQLETKGVSSVLDELLDPDRYGVAAPADPWEGIDFGTYDPKMGRRYFAQTIGSWLRTMATTPRPLHEWMRWFWHGHFVSTLPTVKRPELMVNQLRLFAQLGLGDFRTLLRAVTIDPAMLVYLDGAKSRKGAVNENYGRELLELFTLGIGNYTEADVRAGAEALTGWVVGPSGGSRLVPGLHENTAQSYLGRSGVNSLDSVMDAVVAQDACPAFIATKLCKAILGPDVDRGLVTRLAGEFKAGGLQIKPLLRAVLEAGLDGASTPLVMAPVPWFTSAIRNVGAEVERVLAATGADLVPAGQVPLNAPNVAGWPGGKNWLTSSATIARFNMASSIADLAPPAGPVRSLAGAGDLRELADALGHPAGFGDATRTALEGVRGSGPTSVLTIALASPELVLA
ncbi:MAG: DUF1800 domain-containing protein [Actinobacteria bacterium]|nr:DUF1800 domain-containing protein [Actinomycetota bacterium]